VQLFKDSNSTDYQESFVLSVLKEKQNGFYLELGSAWPKKESNTYLLETVYNWQGIGFEIDKDLVEEYRSVRKNPVIHTDAMTFDYRKHFKENNVPKQIDYLQMDLHPAYSTLQALRQLPLDEYRFSVITYEHNRWWDEGLHKYIQEESQRILKSYGYTLVVENLLDKTNPLEDWWVDPNSVPRENYSNMMSKNKFYRHLLDKYLVPNE
jgi:hypothetical protein